MCYLPDQFCGCATELILHWSAGLLDGATVNWPQAVPSPEKAPDRWTQICGLRRQNDSARSAFRTAIHRRLSRKNPGES